MKQTLFVNVPLIIPGFLSGVIWAFAQIGWFVASDNLSMVVSFPIITTIPAILANIYGEPGSLLSDVCRTAVCSTGVFLVARGEDGRLNRRVSVCRHHHLQGDRDRQRQPGQARQRHLLLGSGSHPHHALQAVLSGARGERSREEGTGAVRNFARLSKKALQF